MSVCAKIVRRRRQPLNSSVRPIMERAPNNVFVRTALTWLGPFPTPNESWASFQLRWAAYSFRWLVEFALAFAALWFLVSRAPEVYSYTLFQLFWFALPIGIGIALFASVGFLMKSAKAHYFGPNPVIAAGNDGS